MPAQSVAQQKAAGAALSATCGDAADADVTGESKPRVESMSGTPLAACAEKHRHDLSADVVKD